jgi:hypothetical protein
MEQKGSLPCSHTSPPLVPILSQIDSAHIASLSLSLSLRSILILLSHLHIGLNTYLRSYVVFLLELWQRYLEC